MSWLFGVKKQPVPDMNSSGEGSAGMPSAGASSGDQQLTKAEKKAMEAYRFDSSALERAAEAAKTLERSSNVKMM
jgi:ATPase family AAA domain-containing protein 3A/B